MHTFFQLHDLYLMEFSFSISIWAPTERVLSVSSPSNSTGLSMRLMRRAELPRRSPSYGGASTPAFFSSSMALVDAFWSGEVWVIFWPIPPNAILSLARIGRTGCSRKGNDRESDAALTTSLMSCSIGLIKCAKTANGSRIGSTEYRGRCKDMQGKFSR